MKKKYTPKYPMIWQKEDFYIKIFCSIPNIATGILIRTSAASFVVDPGDGILRDLNKDLSAKEIIEISDIFISHGHHDHVGGIWSLLTYLSVMKRTRPLQIHYPEGCAELDSIVKAFKNVYGKETSYEIVLNKITKTNQFQRQKVKVKPFKVNHKDMYEDGTIEDVPSLGFKFSYDEKSICYGGDTAYSDELVKHSKGANLAIIEAGALNNEESELHMTIDQAISIGETAKEYFLVHVPE